MCLKEYASEKKKKRLLKILFNFEHKLPITVV